MMPRRAFTLLELLLATVLLTGLMVSVLAVLTRIGTHDLSSAGITSTSLKIEATSADPSLLRVSTSDIDAWIAVLREDIDHAIEIDTSVTNEVTLIGYAGLDDVNRRRAHRPVRVTYKIETLSGRPWLIRRQAWLDVLSNQNVQRDLVCGGVLRFELVSVPGETRAPGEAVRKPPLPGGSVKVRATASDPPEPTAEELHPGGGTHFMLRVWTNPQDDRAAHERTITFKRDTGP